MCVLLQIYQCPVASNQNLTSVSSTWSHTFSHGTNMPMPNNALLPGKVGEGGKSYWVHSLVLIGAGGD